MRPLIKPRKNGALPTAEQITGQLEASRATLAARIAESDALEAALPQLGVDDPEAQSDGISRLAVLMVDIPTRERTIKLLEAAHAEAVTREKGEDFERRKAAQDRKSERLARGARARFDESTLALVQLIEELEQDRRECEALQGEASLLGRQGVKCAESRARQDDLPAVLSSYHHLAHARIPAWGGGWVWHGN